MYYFILVLVFILGLVVGSFLNVVIFRLGTKDNFVNSRSKCLFCEHQLAWNDLFPVFSFLFLRGRCRYCGKKISFQYPLIEIITGFVFVVLFLSFFQTMDFGVPVFLDFIISIFVFCSLIVIFVYDMRHYIIPDEIVYPAIVAVFLLNLLDFFFSQSYEYFSLFNFLLAAILASGFFLFLIIVTKGKGMGGGDVKLSFLMGLFLGFPNILLSLFFAFISGALFGLIMIFAGRSKMESMLPFGPFLISGLVVSYFWGNDIIGWYLNYLLL